MTDIADRLILLKEPNSNVAESYRSLRAALSRSLAKGKRKFLIVSSWGGEGDRAVILQRSTPKVPSLLPLLRLMFRSGSR